MSWECDTKFGKNLPEREFVNQNTAVCHFAGSTVRRLLGLERHELTNFGGNMAQMGIKLGRGIRQLLGVTGFDPLDFAGTRFAKRLQ